MRRSSAGGAPFVLGWDERSGGGGDSTLSGLAHQVARQLDASLATTSLELGDDGGADPRRMVTLGYLSADDACDIEVAGIDDTHLGVLQAWFAADPDVRVRSRPRRDAADNAAHHLLLRVREAHVIGADGARRWATRIAEALRGLVFLPACREAMDELRWADAARALAAELDRSAWAGRAFDAFVRGVRRRSTPVDRWRLDVVVAHLAAEASSSGRRPGPLLAAGIPSFALEEPDPQLRAWANVREILRIQERHPRGGRWLPEVEALFSAADGAKVAWWWLTGEGEPANEATGQWHWAAAAVRVAHALRPFGLLTPEQETRRMAQLGVWEGRAEAHLRRRTAGDPAVATFVAAYAQVEGRHVARAFGLCVEHTLGARAEHAAHLVKRGREVLVACRDEPWGTSGPVALADWCGRAIALGLIGELAEATGSPPELTRPRAEAVLAHIDRLGPILRRADLRCGDDLVGFPLWRAVKTLLRERTVAHDAAAVTRLLGTVAESGAMSVTLAKHSAAAARIGVRAGTEAAEASRRMLLRLVVTTLQQSVAEWAQLRRRCVLARWVPALAGAEHTPLVAALQDLANPRNVRWTAPRFLALTSDLAAGELPEGRDAVSAALDWWTRLAPAGLLEGLGLRPLLLDAEAGRGLFAAEASAVERRLWPDHTVDWFEDGSAIGHNLPHPAAARSACVDAVRAYLREAFSPLSPPEEWFDDAEFPHLFEDLRHLLGARSAAQGNGERNLSLGNVVILLGVALGARVAAGWPPPPGDLLRQVRWTSANRRRSLLPAQSRGTARRIAVGLVRDVLMPRSFRDHAATSECTVSEVRLGATALEILLDFSCLSASGGAEAWIAKIAAGTDRGVREFSEAAGRKEDPAGRPIALESLCALNVAADAAQPSRTLLAFTLVDGGRAPEVPASVRGQRDTAPARRGRSASANAPRALVIDTVDRRRASHVRALEAAGARAFFVDARGRVRDRDGAPARLRTPFTLVLLHHQDADLLLGLAAEPGPILRYSGGVGDGDGRRWVGRSVHEASPLTADELAALLSWAAAGAPDDSAPALMRRREAGAFEAALTVACQAYLALHGTVETSEVRRALWRMGVPSDAELRRADPAAARRVRAPEWWMGALGPPPFTQTSAAAVDALLQAVSDGVDIDPGLVACAYLALAP